MLTREQCTEEACALLGLGVKWDVGEWTKARGPASPLFPKQAIPGGGIVPWDAGTHLGGKTLRDKTGLKSFLPPEAPRGMEWSEPPWKGHLWH